MGSGGRATLYTGSISDSTGVTALVGSGSGNFRYNSNASRTNHTAALGTGTYAVYREQPTLTIAVNNLAAITYGSSAPTYVSSIAGEINGDTVSQALTTLPSVGDDGVISGSGHLTAGTHAVTASGAVDQFGYALNYVAAALTVNKASLVATGLTASAKTYDGTTSTTLGGTATISPIAGDTVTLVGTASGAFANKNVGTAKAVTVTGNTLSGVDAGNYTLVQQSGLTADVTPATLVVTGLTASAKTYDGTTFATLGGTATISPFGSDMITLGGTASGTFANKNVGTAKAVTVTGNTLGGVDAGNYTLVQQSGLTADVTPATLFVTGLTASGKTYDGTTFATLGGTATISPLAGDTVTLGGTASGTFANKNVGTAKAVTVTGNTLSGVDAGNYTLVQQSGLTADITPATLFVTGLTASAKTYDGTTAATLGGAATFSPLAGDMVTLVGTASGNFANKNVGTAKAVTVTGNTLSGVDAGNYTLVQQSGLTADITPATLFVTGLTASAKTYDGTTAATLGGAATFSPLAGDMVTLVGTASGNFANKNVGTAKAVTVTGNTLGGADAGNYTLVQQSGLTADITPATLFVTGLTASAKTYDGTTAATLGGTATISPFGSDMVTLGGTSSGTFANKNVGTAKAVTVTGNTLGGADAGNYTLVQQSGLTADVTPATLVVTGLTASGKTYDGTTFATLGGTATISPFGSDMVTLVGTASGNFANKNVGTAKAVTVTGNTLSGVDAGNYTLVQQSGLTADVTPATLVVTGLTAGAKTYDGTTFATLGGTATISPLAGDTVTLGGTASGTFANKNVGTAKAVTVTGNTLGGADAGNYTLVQQSGLTADVTPATLVVTGLTASGKTYDGTTFATLGGTATISPFGSDMVTLVGTASGTFANKNVGTAKAVTVTGNTLGGVDAGNYTLVQQSELTADVTPATLFVTGLTASAKTYDGTTSATLGGSATISPFGSDMVTLGGTASGNFANKNAGTAKAVTVTGNTLSGVDAGNYTLVQQSGLTADIGKANATVTGNSGSATYDGQSHTVSGFTVTGLVGGELATVLTGVSATASGTGAGSYDVVPVGADGNYNLTRINGRLLIAKADLAVTANDDRKAYDGLRYSGGNGVSYAGFVNGETSNVLEGVLGYGGTSQGAANAGTYSIVPTGLKAANYQIEFIAGMLNISAPPPVSPTVPVPPLPTPSTNPPLLSVGPGEGLGSGVVNGSQNVPLKSNNSSSGSSVVSVLREPSAPAPIPMTVYVPKEVVGAPTGISFQLPSQLLDAAAGKSSSIRVTTINGEPLPSWMKFNAETATFVASSVPEGVFPMQLVVTVNGKSTVVVISNQAGN
nr:YDG domain-containing protein [Pelomonas sp. P8]